MIMVFNIFQFIGLFVFSLAISFLTQLLYKKFTDQERLRELNETIKNHRRNIMHSQDADEKLRLQSEILNISNERFKHMMKPMFASMFLFIFTFPLMNLFFGGFTLITFSHSLPLIGTDIGWFLTYILISMLTSSILRKKMGVYI